MGLETTNTIAGLDSSWPLGGDVTSQGDDQLRLIKNVLKRVFVGELGDGFDQAIVATEQELNWLVGLTDNVQVQLDAISALLTVDSLTAPVGTVMIFNQATTPGGWTQDTSKNDYMMRVVSGSGGAFGGTDSPIINDKIPSHTHTAVASGIHTHTKVGYNQAVGSNLAFPGFDGSGGQWTQVPSDPDGDHTHIIDANVGAANWTPKYLDVILGVKD